MGCQILWVILLSVLLNWMGSFCDSQDNFNSEACSKQESCGACIQTPGCMWCAQKNVTIVRCMLVGTPDLESSCPAEDLVNPKSEKKDIEDKPLSSGHSFGQLVQIRPQRVEMKLRLGETFDLKFEYKQALDYPVDLYYLMDLSGSMKDDKENLSKLGDKLSEAMQKITSNFRIGFGSFVDKVAMPFVSIIPARLKKPCKADETECAPPYSFKNHMPLSNDTREFSKMVKGAIISGNLDSPEGGFDALMQAMVCTRNIGWRQNARHLLVFSTDASFHLAGDGKLAGVVQPNDGLCHMDDGDTLTQEASLEYDYPSISQLNQKAQENNINMIFAVTSSYDELYATLKDQIKGASYGTLNADSSNVIELVRSEYKKLVNSVKLIDINDEFIEVRYFTKCLDNLGEERQSKECKGIRVNNTIAFTAKIKVLSCPADRNERMRKLTIKPEAHNENVTIEIEIICDCPCETPGHKNYEPSTEYCHGGSLKCGVCDCSTTDGLVGRYCECTGSSVVIEDVDSCKANNKTCSDRGLCKCGQCECKQRAGQQFSGKFCECDNYSCPRSNSLLCSGPTHGDCICGACKCKPEWTGIKCECPNNNDTCIAPNNKMVCSGKGNCYCGKCECEVIDNKAKYSPPFCEDCPTCPPQRCQQLERCVGCQAYKSTYKECITCQLNITTVEKLGDANTSEGEHKCTSSDENGCNFEFIYKYENNIDVVRAPKEKDKSCGKIDILAIVLSVTGSTVIIGLLLLVAWKVFTSIHDRREYVRFEKERALSKFDRGDNPLYKPSTVTFNNPTFGN